MEAPAAGLGGIEELEVLLLICSLLASAKDYLSLRLTCRRFDAKIIAAPSGSGTAAAGGGGSTAAAGGGGIAAAEPEMLCIVDEAARRWVAQHSERWVVSRRALESWLGLMHRGPPLVFGRAHDTFTLSENGAVATINADHEKWEGKIEVQMEDHQREMADLSEEMETRLQDEVRARAARATPRDAPPPPRAHSVHSAPGAPPLTPPRAACAPRCTCSSASARRRRG